MADALISSFISLAFSINIQCHLYMQSGTKVRQRLIDITLYDYIYSVTFIGLHCYTGCDTISSFSGQGIKLGALTLVINNHKFRDELANMGWNCHLLALSPDLYDALQEFTCRLYCPKSLTCDIKITRLRRASCGDSYIYQHAKYQAVICHRRLVICPDIPRPDDDRDWIFDA